MRYIILSFVLLIFPINAYSQIIRHVPADHSTIQAALDAANPGETILVQAGTYYESIHWPNKKGLILTGISSDSVIISGSNMRTIIGISSVDSSIDGTTIIKNLTLKHGSGPYEGGGLYISNCSPTLINLYIDSNVAYEGSGIYLLNSFSLIKNCVISAGYGPGVYIDGGNVKIDSSYISQNHGDSEIKGDGIFIKYKSTCIVSNSQINNNSFSGINNSGTLQVNNCVLKRNSFTEIFMRYGSCTIDSSTLEGDHSIGSSGIYSQGNINILVKNSKILSHKSVFGAAIYSINSYQRNEILELENCVIAYNLSEPIIAYDTTFIGGAVYGSNLKLNQVTFIDNLGGRGGAVAAEGGGAFIQHCTFYNNPGSLYPGAVYLRDIQVASNGISYNNFFNNGYGLFNYNNGRYINAGNNYWGDSSGPYNRDSNPNGLGDSTGSLVNVSPWLTEPDTSAPLIFPRTSKY